MNESQLPKRLGLKAQEAAYILGIPKHTVYTLSTEGGPLERRYIGKGTRNFVITYESVERYFNSLPTEPVQESA